MRIGMMADVYKPHISGITNYISLSKRHLEAQGHEVFIFTFGDEDYEDDETNVVRSPGLPLLDTGYYISLRYNRLAQRLLHTMDLVHVHHPFLSGSLALRYCRPRRLPIVFTSHTRYDLYSQAYLPGLPDVFSETALEAYLPAFCRACDAVIAPSQGMREVLERFGVDAPVEVIPNGVDLAHFHHPLDPINRAELGYTPEDVVMIYVGRLGPEKNLPFLLRSFSGTVQVFDHARLLIIGDGPEYDNLVDRTRHMGIADKVHFAGMLPYEAVPCYLAMADAFVTASVTEVHPLSLIEAMAAGLPALGILSPGIGDTIQDGETGYLAREEDLAAFTARMVRLVMDHPARRQMGEKARLASQRYDIRHTTRLVLECYQAVVEKARRKPKNLQARLLQVMDRLAR